MRLAAIHILAFAFLFLACKNEVPSKYIGEWTSTKKPIPYSAKLIVKADSTFEFKGGACTISFWSSGKWCIKNDMLILQSNTVDTEIRQKDFGSNCVPLDSLLAVSQNHRQDKSEEEYVVFTKQTFHMKDDILQHIYQDSLCFFKNDFVKRH